MLLTPEYLFRGVSAITPEFLAQRGIRALALDVDNTLAVHDSPELPPAVAAWLGQMRTAGIAMCIVSNNNKARVAPFAAKLGLPFVSLAAKPLPFGLAAARRRCAVPKRAFAAVGDQLFTDRLAAALYGVPGLVVLPLAPETHKSIERRRKWEAPYIQKYYDQGGTLL